MLLKANRLLVVGGLPDNSRKRGYGGATVLMQNFIDYLRNHSLPFHFVQTNRFFLTNGRPFGLANIAVALLQFAWQLLWCRTVMFNFSDHATCRVLPLAQRLAHLLGRHVVLRKFGGSLDIYLSGLPEHLRRRTLHTLSRCDLVLLETYASIDYVRQHVGTSLRVEWFPNVRRPSPYRSSERYRKRLVFISHILDEKGVADLLAVAEQLPQDYRLNFYGPICQNKYARFDWSAHHATYGGILTPEEVLLTLSQSSLLLLTSYREGYPGIIIEAMSVGVPCIATTVGGIPEIVENEQNGLLVKAGDRDAILRAILSVNQESYARMRTDALRRFDTYFNSEHINEHIVQLLCSL